MSWYQPRGFTHRCLILTGFLLVWPWPTTAQVGKDSDLWLWTHSGNHHRSIVEVKREGGIGAGVIVYAKSSKPGATHRQGLCATALHVVEPARSTDNISVTFADASAPSPARIVATDQAVDLALLQVTIPRSISACRLSRKLVTCGDELEIVGLGGGSDLQGLRSFSTKASAPTNSDQIFADVALLPGDSGGAVFDEDQRIVGIVSGGWFWFDAGVRTAEGAFIKATWPARACNSLALRRLMRKALRQGLPEPPPIELAQQAAESSEPNLEGSREESGAATPGAPAPQP